MGGDGCSHKCIVENGWTCTGSAPDVCTRVTDPPTVSLDLPVSDPEKVSITFSTDMVQDSSSLNFIKLSIQGSNSPYDISFTPKWVTSTKIEITITYESNLIRDGTELLYIRITNPNVFVSSAGVPMTKSEIFSVELTGSEEASLTGAVGSTATAALSSSFMVSAAANVVVGSSMEKMWSLVNTCQLIFYLALVSVYFPRHLIAFFSYLKLANMDNQLLASITMQLFVREDEDKREAVNYRYNEMGYETISFLENVSDLIALALILILCTIIFVFITFIRCLRRYKWTLKLVTKLESIYKYNAILRLGVESYLDLSLACLIEIYFTVSHDDIYSSKLFYIVCGILAILLSFLAFSFAIVLRNVDKISGNEEERAKIKWFSSYFEDFKAENVMQMLFYPFFLLRRTVFVFALA